MLACCFLFAQQDFFFVSSEIQRFAEKSAEEQAQAESRRREELVNEKLKQQAQQRSEAAAPVVAPPAQPQIVQQAPAPATSSSSSDNVLSWNASQVADWVRSSLNDEALAAVVLKEGIGGNAFFVEFTARDYAARLGVEEPMRRRKLEHAVSRVRDPLLAKMEEEKAKQMRIFEGTIAKPPSADQQPGGTRQTLSAHLQDGIFAYLSHGSRSFSIEVQNDSRPPCPIVLVVEVRGENVDFSRQWGDESVSEEGTTSRVVWILPQMEVKLVSQNGRVVVQEVPSKNEKGTTRMEVAAGKVIDRAQPWKLSYRVSYKFAIVDDWALVREQQIHRQMHQMLDVTNWDEVEDLSVAQIEAGLETANLQFIDPSFQPDRSSLFMNPKAPPSTAVPIQWKRPQEFLAEPPQLFKGPPSPFTIQQGRLGDCWALAALSIVASVHPKHVMQLFETQKTSSRGIYACRFYRNGQWKRVIVDDYIPCTPSTGFLPFDMQSADMVRAYLQGTGTHATQGPVYARNLDQSLWLCILEKAYAKLNKSYEALAGGNMAESFTDFTGSPSVSFYLPWHDKEDVWGQLVDGHRTGKLMGCSTRALTPEERASGFELERYGIVGHHAYAILDVRQVQGLRLIRLRNPWGTFVWNGDYSDSSDKWNVQLKQAVGFKEEQGTFWMLWKDFCSFFHDITLCLFGVLPTWKTHFVQNGTYNRANQYGVQCIIRSEEPSQALVTVAKADLRFASGSDKDNRQGLYLLSRNRGSTSEEDWQYVMSTGEVCRRELSLGLVTLQPDKEYLAVVMSQIGNVQFSSVDYSFAVDAQSPKVSVEMLEPRSRRLCQAMVLDMASHMDSHERINSEFYALQHLCFYSDVDGTPNSSYLNQFGGIGLLLNAFSRYPKERDLNNVGLSLLWNVATDPKLRQGMREAGVVQVCTEIKQRYYNDVELGEVCDVLARTVQNATAVALDPLIEECILKDCCTFAVTGKKCFLLQAWYDCYTCLMRSSFGICQTCATTCHAGHSLSPPKYSRFYCDCGSGVLLARQKKRGGDQRIEACKCLRNDVGLDLKRSQDKNFYDFDQDEPDIPDDPEEVERKKRARPKKNPEKATGLRTLH